MELCLKAVLRAVGIEYPKVHDVSDVLVEVKGRFPSWFQREVNFLSESSKVLVSKREMCFYGGEEGLLPPEELVSRADANDAVRRAGKTYGLCDGLLEELRRRNLTTISRGK